MTDLFIGIDPGVSGAIAVRSNNEVWVENIPVVKVKTGKGYRTHYDIAALVSCLRGWTDDGAATCIAVVEKVGPMPRDGCIQAFSLGHGLGILEGVLTSFGVQTMLVAPRVWKKTMGLTSDKELSRRRALEAFPELADRLTRKKDEGRAEALLLLKWLELHGER